jgi:hypothetical protein
VIFETAKVIIGNFSTSGVHCRRVIESGMTFEISLWGTLACSGVYGRTAWS